MIENVNLKIWPDKYSRNRLLSCYIYVILNINTQWDRNNIFLVNIFECYKEFINVQDSDYERNVVQKFKISFEKLKILFACSYLDMVSVRNFKVFDNEVSLRLRMYDKENMTLNRKIQGLLGDFEESLSPRMIHRILTWLKEKNPEKYGEIKRTAKEDIINNLKKIGTKIDVNLCLEFIEWEDPVLLIKDFDIKLHKKGKRIKNSELRQVLKQKIYDRDRNYLRCVHISPHFRGLPKCIEDNITSFLIK
uniref:Uncharacterized protein n=1 Tax=viral metagenome TaxID=1070528 RepID=A0A6C0KYS7_9ZZZZ|tara:strand:- start:743 stop:1489 length:747 start_codon:yes stop_codon:yes gene_type:complete